VAKVWWFVARPRVVGVKCLLRDGERVLLVRHAYGDRGAWELPGGHGHRGERPEETARREALEELGVDVEAWRQLGTFAARTDRKRETVHVLEASCPAGAQLRPAPGELEEVRWSALDAPPGRLGPSTRSALAVLRAAR
jgi:8-oxo-dGTP pyrophosphatase MutT (NUDIX family)